ncbi:hypothetical protein A2673_01095 [Candidatus Kaiserbacteria bacterium RIFCSPHIGHO2_01_FULL_50_13]|uniref:Endolytic murein transglycosylase n=1 Tax=Candidatus Kaiserbacteria bacterium RIFCSPLOWO2_01_FULL_50_24 TaxID=1798507 RepID=A0A1F6EMQ4_9BACT|nr:MAG: hypothetical protein A2673_01095 [Candidatus Kaiserbacteria bacterium RIFCSPHIGHO2_01_FULL_50_13]OGG74928.1 MAG: hypothetical protein A3A34_03875 [Candidatus Kaiserbacteria bacterium RIFCSPLOWO2_01_FULL_50_24]OGG82242.1 MAG: hypothetical protein A3H74_03540 [Candidatus Kaiserbacteria bacterium RIFCSPLOWO2_02_FULL_51_13]
MAPNDMTSFLQRAFTWKEEAEENFFRRWDKQVNKKTLIIASVLGIIALLLYITFIRPPQDFPLHVLVTIEEGATLSSVAAQLEKESVVRSSFALRALVPLFGSARSVKAGDYLFEEPKNVFSMARIVSRGVYGLEPMRVRIPEGTTVRDMAHIYDTYLLRFDPEKFITQATEYEGYLYPDTYFFLPNVDEAVVIRTMQQNFDAQTATIASEVEAFGEPFSDIVIMASLLEREANNTEDRRKIAGVLWNRVERDMPLQVDAVFLYTLGRTTFELTTEDLASDSPYNTYRYKGFPPTPIGSPSLDSLRAAVMPENHDYLFYLADRNHVTYYSRTYEEHLRKKAMYLGS